MNSIFSVFLVIFLTHNIYVNAQDNNYIRGKSFFDIGQFYQAIPFFSESINKNTKEKYESLLYRGQCYLFINQIDAAKKDLYSSRTGLKDTFMPDLNAALGMLYNRKGQNKKALEYFNNAIKLRPLYAIAYNNRGITWQDMGNFRNALADYSAAIRIDSNFALAYSNRGSATYYDQNIADAHTLDIESAIRDFTKAFALDPHLCMAVRNRALCYQFLKKLNSALTDVNTAINCEPVNPLNYLVRGAIYYDLKNFILAENDFRKSLSLNPHLPEAYLQMGITIARMGRTVDGLLMEDSAVSIDKRYSAMASYTKAQINAIAGNEKAMLQNLETAKKQGYFKNRKNYEQFLKSEDFTAYNKNKKFKEFNIELKSKGAKYFKVNRSN